MAIEINQPIRKTVNDKSEVLTSLDFLKEGQPWPPKSQERRLAKYKLNKSKFDNKLDINRKAYDYIISLVDDRFRVISYRMLINLYRKVTYKTADLLFVERPKYVSNIETQKTLKEIVDLSKLGSIGYEGAMDVSIYGDALYTIKIPDLEPDAETGEKDQGKARMGISNPRYWFPVVSETDLKEIKYHVLAHTVIRIEPTADDKNKEVKYLIYQVHSKGSYTTSEVVITDGGILGPKPALAEGEEEQKIDTGLTDFAVIPTAGVTTSDSIFGIDDYTDIINLIDELQIRLEKIAHVLDKHSDPSMSGPASALKKDKESGEYSIKVGGYFQRDSKEAPDVSYITWDGKLESSFKEIELILDLLAVITEMGSAIFDRESGGGDLSGRALKLLYVSPLTKVSRVRNNFDDAFKHSLSLCSEVGYGGKPIPASEISIEWKDGLPNDPKEMAEIGQARVVGATDTVAHQIMEQDGLDEDDAVKKAALISAEAAATFPAISSGVNIDNLLNGGDEAALPGAAEGAAPQNIEATEGLNGAQINAALDVFEKLSAGTIAKGVAVELLVAVGIGKDKAETMVAEQSEIKIEAE